jgi:hypothetical protein
MGKSTKNHRKPQSKKHIIDDVWDRAYKNALSNGRSPGQAEKIADQAVREAKVNER